MSILFAILLFSFLIFIHELGHFIAAKKFGVKVNEFSIFMGPVLWKTQRGETTYSIRCIPFGGFCAMEGENGDSDSQRSFTAAAWWKRLVILAAGSAMNFLAGVLLLAIFFLPDKYFIVPTVSEVAPQCSFGGSEGLQVGDRLLKLDGEPIYVYTDFNLLLSLSSTTTHELTVKRDGKTLRLSGLTMEKREIPNEDGTTSLRLGFSFSTVDATIGEKISFTWATVKDTVRLVWLSLRMLFTGKAGIQDVSGPVGIVSEMSNVAKASGSFYYAMLNLIYFGGFIAINLAVMNMLPIPALDGGRIFGLLVTLAIEKITRRTLDPKYEAYVHGAGMILLLALMAILLFKDIFFIFR